MQMCLRRAEFLRFCNKHVTINIPRVKPGRRRRLNEFSLVVTFVTSTDPCGPWRHGRQRAAVVIVTFIRSKATGHTSSTDPRRSNYITSVGGRLSRPTEGGSRRRGGAEQLLLGEQPLADGHRVVLDGRQRHAMLVVHVGGARAAACEAVVGVVDRPAALGAPSELARLRVEWLLLLLMIRGLFLPTLPRALQADAATVDNACKKSASPTDRPMPPILLSVAAICAVFTPSVASTLREVSLIPGSTGSSVRLTNEYCEIRGCHAEAVVERGFDVVLPHAMGQRSSKARPSARGAACPPQWLPVILMVFETPTSPPPLLAPPPPMSPPPRQGEGNQA
eukprot:scaffold22359_cov63-Phaeocystis_antarctica.AAC.3